MSRNVTVDHVPDFVRAGGDQTAAIALRRAGWWLAVAVATALVLAACSGGTPATEGLACLTTEDKLEARSARMLSCSYARPANGDPNFTHGRAIQGTRQYIY
jgi:hypothetical protein